MCAGQRCGHSWETREPCSRGEEAWVLESRSPPTWNALLPWDRVSCLRVTGILGRTSVYHGDCPGCCKMFSSTPDPHPLDVTGISAFLTPKSLSPGPLALLLHFPDYLQMLPAPGQAQYTDLTSYVQTLQYQGSRLSMYFKVCMEVV